MNTATLPTQAPAPTRLVHDVLPPEPVRTELVAPIPVRRQAETQPLPLPMGDPEPLSNPISDSAQALPQVHQAVHAAKQNKTSSGRPILAITSSIAVAVALCAAAIFTLS